MRKSVVCAALGFFFALSACGTELAQNGALPVYKGRVGILDGRTLWYPKFQRRVRLADIDVCEPAQWALNPLWRKRGGRGAPEPVPCGALAKAWLKRTVEDAPVVCAVVSYDAKGEALASCRVKNRDLGAEMLRVGWARVVAGGTANTRYLAYQEAAMAARHGMWATYVLDMNEWRRKAVDKTLARQPIADFNLLKERESEISPPFADARRRPGHRDR